MAAHPSTPERLARLGVLIPLDDGDLAAYLGVSTETLERLRSGAEELAPVAELRLAELDCVAENVEDAASPERVVAWLTGPCEEFAGDAPLRRLSVDPRFVRRLLVEEMCRWPLPKRFVASGELRGRLLS